MKRLSLLLLMMTIPAVLFSADSDEVMLELNLNGLNRIELGFSSSPVTSWTQDIDEVPSVQLVPRSDGVAYLETSLFAYARIQSSESGIVYMISSELEGYSDAQREQIEGAELGWEVDMLVDDSSRYHHEFSSDESDVLSDEPVFIHDGINDSTVQIYNAETDIRTLGNYFDLLDTGARAWRQTLTLGWETT